MHTQNETIIKLNLFVSRIITNLEQWTEFNDLKLP